MADIMAYKKKKASWHYGQQVPELHLVSSIQTGKHSQGYFSSELHFQVQLHYVPF